MPKRWSISPSTLYRCLLTIVPVGGGGTLVYWWSCSHPWAKKQWKGYFFYTHHHGPRRSRLLILCYLGEKGILFSSPISTFWISKAWHFTVVLYLSLFCRLLWHFCPTSQVKNGKFSGNYGFSVMISEKDVHYGRSVKMIYSHFMWISVIRVKFKISLGGFH